MESCEKYIRSIVKEIIRESLDNIGIDSFVYDSVKKQIQQAINNGGLNLSDISSDKYFIVCFDMFGSHVSTLSSSDKKEVEGLIKHFKNDEYISKIYIEKPSIGAKVFLRKEWGWVSK